MRFTIKAGCLAFLLSSTTAIQLNPDNRDSVKAAAKTVAAGMMNYYHGSEYGMTPGLLPPPSYWWQCGALMGSLVDYWFFTGDSQYNSKVMEAMLWQAAPGANFEPVNQTKTLGNDDQAFWAMTAMRAAETNFENPPSDQPQWLALVQSVFNRQAARWETSTCNGGLRWQIFWFNQGYHYKNAISQGCFFNLAARLGMYTGNSSYFDQADKMWDWTSRVGIIDSNDTYAVYDGTDDNLNCTELNHLEWSYNNAIFLHGAAVMWNQTNGTRRATWETRIRGLIKHGDIFFTDNVMTEQACEGANNCNNDQQSFKAYMSRWQAASTQVAPWTADLLLPRLKTSAVAAAQACSGGTDGVTCGTRWYQAYDGKYGVGQQMSALEVIQSQLVQYASGPLGNSTGASSVGNAGAGTSGPMNDPTVLPDITTADRAGAGILTAMSIIFTLTGGWWLCTS